MPPILIVQLRMRSAEKPRWDEIELLNTASLIAYQAYNDDDDEQKSCGWPPTSLLILLCYFAITILT